MSSGRVFQSLGPIYMYTINCLMPVSPCERFFVGWRPSPIERPDGGHGQIPAPDPPLRRMYNTKAYRDWFREFRTCDRNSRRRSAGVRRTDIRDWSSTRRTCPPLFRPPSVPPSPWGRDCLDRCPPSSPGDGVFRRLPGSLRTRHIHYVKFSRKY